MAKITRIKASDPGKSPEESVEALRTVKKVKVGKDSTKAAKPAKITKKAEKSSIKAEKSARKTERTNKKALKNNNKVVKKKEGNYFKNAWLELRQVRWPSRKATWKMVAAIFVYTGLFIAIIMLLDALFTWLFGLILG